MVGSCSVAQLWVTKRLPRASLSALVSPHPAVRGLVVNNVLGCPSTTLTRSCTHPSLPPALHSSRAAELEFKKATALQLLDSPAEALAAMQSAKAHLSTHLASVNADIAKAGSSGADVSGAVASAAFASILGGYASSAPAAADADASAGKESAELAKLHALVCIPAGECGWDL